MLAGGRSRRFGRDKALAEFGGRTLLQLAIDRFSACGACAVAARDNLIVADHARASGAHVICDASNAAEGPLAGIAAGLVWADAMGFSLLAIAPCDAPLLTWRDYERLANAMGDSPGAFAVTAGGEHPLCAVLRCEVQATLSEALAEGRHPPIRNFLRLCGARPVKFDDAKTFANANTTQALARLSTETPL